MSYYLSEQNKMLPYNVEENYSEETGLTVWEYRNYISDLSDATLTLKELLVQLRKSDTKPKTPKRSDPTDSDSLFSDNSDTLSSPFLNNWKDNDSGVSLGTCSDKLKSQMKVLTPREKQKMDREVIRQKLSMADSDEEDVNFLYQSRFQRSYSANNQSLQICYINESCSSDDNSADEDIKSPKEDPKTPSSPSFSPRTGYGSGYLRKNRISDTSSHSSSSSIGMNPLKSESTVVRTNSQDLRSGRSRQEEMELEARFQLAQAHQRAKLEAAHGRKMKKNTCSLAHRLLSNTLDDETTRKIKTYSLCKSDCRRMTLGQLQLILNDMHAQKQALNDDLVYLLTEREDLRMEQDGKLMEVDDAKAIMNDVGPETTV